MMDKLHSHKPDMLEPYPKLLAHMNRMMQLPKIIARLEKRPCQK